MDENDTHRSFEEKVKRQQQGRQVYGESILTVDVRRVWQ